MLNSNTTNLRTGDRAGNYEILEMAGAGGMGVVYKARDLKLERTVALKFLPLDADSSTKQKEQFLKEARTASSLDHPNIGVIHGVEETTSGRLFIVMAFYEGESLAQKIRKGLTFHEAVDIALQMAKGLEAAHARNVIHRDVKPGNVLITPDGLVKIVDFGLARVITSVSMTQTGGTSGTVGYMSPEQSLGKAIDRRTDIWALGVVLAEMLSGQNPFWHDNVSSIVVAILSDPPRPMKGVPVELQQIVYRALSKDPVHRYQSCSELRDELENARNVLGPAVEVDPLAPTLSLKSAQLQKYIDHASRSAWNGSVPRKNLSTQLWISVGAVLALTALALIVFPATRHRLLGALGSSEHHIAVLPFDNVGNDPANAPLAEGLMESLAGKLSDLDESGKSLWVVPSTEVRHRNISDPGTALRELGATLVVKGSVARNGKDLRLAVNLIDTKNLRQIGSANVEDTAGDLVKLQDQIVARLAKLMHVKVPTDMPGAAAASSNPAAYESYLKALGYVRRYDTPGNLDLAITALNEAVKADPQFALGFAELGEAYQMKNLLDPNPKWIEQVSTNSNRALQLNDRLPAAYVTLGNLHRDSDKFELALQEYEHALRLEPHNADAVMGTASTYEKMGRLADAEETFKKGAALRPDYWDGYNSLGNFYDRQGKYPEAIANYQHAAELTPDNTVIDINLAAAYLDRGSPPDLPAAEAALKKSITLGPTYPAYANLGLLYLNEKRFAESVTMTQKALQLNDKDYLVWANLMAAYQGLNQKGNFEMAREHAITLLEQAVMAKPQTALTQVSLASLYAQKGLKEKAITRAQAALARAPDNPNVLELAGETYESLGDRRHALEYIDRALKNGYPLDQLKDAPELHNLLSDPDFRPVPGKPNP
jgi:tetratricopeptide (TPR) repeat protein/tRNA A-37 threonylcarbamoyl transferase component Bud32